MRIIVGFSNRLLLPVLMQIEESELERPLRSTVFQTYLHGIGYGIDIIWHDNLLHVFLHWERMQAIDFRIGRRHQELQC